MKSQFRHQTKK